MFRDRLQSVDLASVSLTPQKPKRQTENTSLLITDALPRGLLRLKENESPTAFRCSSENIRLWKDISVLAVAVALFNVIYYGLLFTSLAFNPLQLVLATHTVNFSSQIVCALFLSHFLYRSARCKLAISISLATVVIFAAAQFHPDYATLVPAGMLIGAGFVTLRITSLQYGNLLSRYYVASSVQLSPSITYVIFGCVNYAPILGGVVGALLPALITSYDRNTDDKILLRNSSYECGPNYPTSAFDVTDLPVLYSVYVIIGCTCVLIVALFLNGRKELEELFLEENSSICQQWTVVISELVVTDVRLPLVTLISGLVWSYSIADLAPIYDPHVVSLLSTTHLAFFFVTIILVSNFTRNMNPNFVTLLTCILCFFLLLLQIIWRSENLSLLFMYFFDAGFGTINGLFYVMNHVEWGSMKSSGEVTYNVCFSLHSLGCVLGFAWTIVLCLMIKLYIYMGFLVLAIVLHVIAIVLQYRPSRIQQMM